MQLFESNESGNILELEFTEPNIPYGQKNWMHLPLEHDSESVFFVYKLSPLQIVEVSPYSGVVKTAHVELNTPTILQEYRGSSGIIFIEFRFYSFI